MLGLAAILSAVEAGNLPMRAAMDIVEAGDDDAALQATLQSVLVLGLLALLESRRDFIQENALNVANLDV